MNDFEVREMAGVRGTKPGGEDRWVALKEHQGCVEVAIDGSFQTYINVADARKLANQLRRLALRIEKRIVVK